MSRWRELHDVKASGNKDRAGTVNKGLARLLRQLKQQEAEFRNSNTLHENTKRHRLGRCECDAIDMPRVLAARSKRLRAKNA